VIAPERVARLIGLDEDDRNEMLMRTIGVRELAIGLGILIQPTAPGWAWARVGGDAMDLALLAGSLDEGTGEKDKKLATMAAVAGIAALDVLCATQLAAPRGAAVRPGRRWTARSR
jgi:hypothetical protein